MALQPCWVREAADFGRLEGVRATLVLYEKVGDGQPEQSVLRPDGTLQYAEELQEEEERRLGSFVVGAASEQAGQGGSGSRPARPPPKCGGIT